MTAFLAALLCYGVGALVVGFAGASMWVALEDGAARWRDRRAAEARRQRARVGPRLVVSESFVHRDRALFDQLQASPAARREPVDAQVIRALRGRSVAPR